MIAIVAVAIYAITTFLHIGKTADLGLFHQRFQETVDDVWATSITNRVFSFSLPSSIKFVCFGNLAGNSYNPQYETQFRELKRYASGFEQQNTNRFLYPQDKAGGFGYKKIDKIDLSALTNGFDCFAVNSGKVMVRLVKEDFDPLVKIEHE